MIQRDGSSTSSVAAMIVLTTAPAVPGMLVARSNVLCTVYVPVASSGLFGGWLLPPPPPPSSPPMSEEPGPQAAVALSASEATRARRVVVIMVFSRRGLLPSALCSACATSHHDAAAVASRSCRARRLIDLPATGAEVSVGPTTRVADRARRPAHRDLRRRWARRAACNPCKLPQRSYSTAATGAGPRALARSPAAGLALVLLGQPALERGEVLEDRRGVHLAGAG